MRVSAGGHLSNLKASFLIKNHKGHENMKPQLLHLYGSIWITSYGLLMALGLAVFLSAAFFHRNRRRYISDIQFFDGASAGIIGGLVGGKLLFLLQGSGASATSWYDMVQHLLGGFAILGATIGALASVITYLWWQELAIREVLDIAGAYASLANGIARFGCFFAGCCYGKLSAVAWLSVKYSDPASLAPLHVLLYPTQVMMAVASLLGFLLLRFVIYPWRGRPLGTVIAWYVLYESVARFLIDFLRGDRDIMVSPLQQGWSFSFYQHIAILVMLGAVGAIVVLHQ